VDLKTGAVLAVTLQEGDQGDTTTVGETLAQAGENGAELIGTEEPSRKPKVHLPGIEEVVTDKALASLAALLGHTPEPTRSSSLIIPPMNYWKWKS
jgi:hypothetical protein